MSYTPNSRPIVQTGDLAATSAQRVLAEAAATAAAASAALAEDFANNAGSHNHDDRYYTEAEVTALLAGKSDTGHNHDDRYYTEAEVTALLGGKSDTGHNHDDRYYTEAEVDGLLTNKAGINHNHDDRYYTETEADARYLQKSGGTLTGNLAVPAEGAVSFGGDHNTWGAVTLYAAGGQMIFRTGSAERMRLFSDGSFGIGTSTPEAKLDVNGTTIARSDIRIKTASYPKMMFEATGNASGLRKWQMYVGPTGTFRFGQLNDAEDAELSSASVSFTGVLKAGTAIMVENSYTVGTLPAASIGTGAMLYCTNVRVLGAGGGLEGAGAGTGGLVTSNGSTWRVAGTNITAQA